LPLQCIGHQHSAKLLFCQAASFRIEHVLQLVRSLAA
jgi:hypothetical protein